MRKAYVIKNDGTSREMEAVQCVNEDKDLQTILEKNYDLLPGDQIKPDDPCNWMLIQREMPVPDPSTGGNRWSIDFFFADQEAMPTFVECKRLQDSRSRREVIGQMFEYAANGHYYWGQGEILECLNKTYSSANCSAEDALRQIHPSDEVSLEGYAQRIEDYLKEGQMRLVFFLEEAPMELRSIVDFLNKQMSRAEVLIVEANQYVFNDSKIVVPSVFGYTEEARINKKQVKVTTNERRHKWDEADYFADAEQRLSQDQLAALRQFYDYSKISADSISWGTGISRGSFSPKYIDICPRAFISMYSDGGIQFNFGHINGSDIAEKARDDFL